LALLGMSKYYFSLHEVAARADRWDIVQLAIDHGM